MGLSLFPCQRWFSTVLEKWKSFLWDITLRQKGQVDVVAYKESPEVILSSWVSWDLIPHGKIERLILNLQDLVYNT
jgi:hypothetical protein